MNLIEIEKLYDQMEDEGWVQLANGGWGLIDIGSECTDGFCSINVDELNSLLDELDDT